MTITSGGNVLIGTTTDSGGKLQLSYAGTADNVVRLVGGGGTTAGNMLLSKISDYSDNSPINLFWADHGSTARTNTLVRIHSNETAAGGYPLRVTAQGSLSSPTYEALSVNYLGNVLIGTTFDAGERLQVLGSVQSFQTSSAGISQLIADSSSSSTHRGALATFGATAVGNLLGFSRATNSFLYKLGGSLVVGTENSFPLVFSTADVQRMRIDQLGNVGIGTSPGYRLDVRGDFCGNYVAGIINTNLTDCGSSGCLVLVGGTFNSSDTTSKYISFRRGDGSEIGSVRRNGTANVAFETSSDYRLKTDLKDFNGLDKVSKIKVYDFKWVNDNQRMEGVIAHELQEVMPYAVGGIKDAIDDNGNILAQGVDYSKIVPILIKAIQEQQQQIQELKNKLS